MILIDSASRSDILRGLNNPAIAGVTTNPTLVAQACGETSLPLDRYLDVVEELCRLPGELRQPNFRQLMVQVAGPATGWDSQISRFSTAFKSWEQEGNLWIKLPPTIEGLTASAVAQAKGLNTLVTAVFTVPQALAAIDADADGIAVYLRRMIQNDDGWQHRLQAMSDLLKARDKTLLIASIPDLEVLETALNFSCAVTVSPKIIDVLLTSVLSQKALDAFAGSVTPHG
jgi:transaldolase